MSRRDQAAWQKLMCELAPLAAADSAAGAAGTEQRRSLLARAAAQATTPARVLEVLRWLDGATTPDVPFLLREPELAAHLCLVRDLVGPRELPALESTVARLVARYPAARALELALFPSRAATLVEALEPGERGSRLRSGLYSAALDVALDHLPSHAREGLRRRLVAGLSTTSTRSQERSGAHLTAETEATQLRRSNELLLHTLQAPELRELARTLGAAANLEERVAAVDAYHVRTLAGLGGGRGGPSLAVVARVAHALRDGMRTLLAGGGSLLLSGSITNGKWRAADSDIDVAPDKAAARVLLDTLGSPAWGRAGQQDGPARALLDELSLCEAELSRLCGGVARGRGELLALTMSDDAFRGYLVASPAFFADTSPISVRIDARGCTLVVHDLRDLHGPPLIECSL